MKKYDKYKDSGFDWVGEIPEHWEIKKMSYCFETIGSGTTPKSNNLEYYDGEYFWLQTGDLNDNEIFFTTRKITQKALDDHSTLRFYPKESVVIAMYGATIGKLGFLRIETTTNQACCVLSKPKDIEPKFVFYWFLSIRQEIISLSYGGGQPNINQEQIKNLKVQLPLTQEQTAIADYLDRKTNLIDELISKKEQLLELYEEEKTAIINQAVTKGINPDAPMKDSGIEWLGKIPKHWDFKKLKYLVDINKETLSDKTDSNYQIKYIDIGNVEYGKLKEKPKQLLFGKAPSRARRVIKSGDTLISTVRTYLKAILFIENADDNLIASTGFAVITPSDVFLPKYLFYTLSSENILQNITANSEGVSYPAINASEIGEFYCWFPEITEQTTIVQYLEKEINRINAKSEKTKKLIELLKEYKQALISEVVTGKIKVI